MTVTVAPETPDAKKTITARGWVATNLALLVVVVLLNFLLVWRVDEFGILRDARGRSIHTSRHERKAKYLLNYHYVPENFNALVIGTSQSLNWHLEDFAGYRFYNESLLGANGVEEKLFVDRALKTGHFKVALVGISHGMTDSAALQDGLDEVRPQEALGSFYSYVMMLDRLARPHSMYGADGSWQMTLRKPDPPDYSHTYEATKLQVKSLVALEDLVKELIAQGAKIVYFIAPQYGLEVPNERAVFANYKHDVLPQMPPGPVIDFNADEYAWLHDDPKYFIDDSHLSPLGATVVSKIINEKMQGFLAGK